MDAFDAARDLSTLCLLSLCSSGHRQRQRAQWCAVHALLFCVPQFRAKESAHSLSVYGKKLKHCNNCASESRKKKFTKTAVILSELKKVRLYEVSLLMNFKTFSIRRLFNFTSDIV